MKDWYSAKELEGCDDLPSHYKNISRMARKENWKLRKKQQVKGVTYEYHISSLPRKTREHLRKKAKELRKESERQALKQVIETINLEDDAVKRQQELEKRNLESLATLNGITEVRKQKALIRAGLVYQYQSFRNSQDFKKGDNAMLTFIQVVNSLQLPYAKENSDVLDMTRVSTQALYRWVRVLNEKGVAGLALEHNRSLARKRRSIINDQPELAEFIEAVIVEYPYINSKKMLRALEVRFGDKMQLPKETALRYWMKDWKKQNASEFTSMTNPDKWRNEFMVAFGDMGERAEGLNVLWELDATPSDIECVWEGGRKRVHLSGVLDVWSRRLKLLVTETPRTVANCALMRRAILDWGLPQVCKTDNGSDYVSMRMKQTFISLSIEQELCNPFSPQEKPHVERAFRTFSHDLLEMMPGYVGHNVAERKAIEARKSFARRLFTKGDVIEAYLSPQELQAFCDKWLEIYHSREHAALNCSPAVKAAQWEGTVARIGDERALDMLLAEPVNGGGRRKVTKKGVKVDNIWYIAAELSVGDWVHVYYDDTDVGRLVVYNDDHEFLCIAQAPEFTGVSRQELASMAKRKQAQEMRRAAEAMRKARSKHNVRELVGEIMEHELAKARNVTPFPAKDETVTSPTLEAGLEAHDALESLDKPAEGSAITQADIDRLNHLIRDDQKEDETEEDRFRRWIGLHELLEAGETLSEFDEVWKKRYEDTPEFKGRKLIFDDWGKSAFTHK